MILMRANPFWGPVEREGPENQDFFGPWNGNKRSECHLGPKKSKKNPAGSWKIALLWKICCFLEKWASEPTFYWYCVGQSKVNMLIWWVFGYSYNQLPRLIEQTPQWLSGPSPLLPVAAGSPPITEPDSNYVLTRCNFYSTIGMGWHKNA